MNNQRLEELRRRLVAGFKSDWEKLRRVRWRKYRPWLIFVPVVPIVAVILFYSALVIGFTPPSTVLNGTHGLEILDRNGNPVFTFADEPGSGRVLPLSDMSQSLLDATVAVEDADFWSNPGVNVKGLARAAYENLAFWETGGLFKGTGGSSISQQLVKNLYIAPEDRAKRDPSRKLKETLLAFELTRRYSKQQILEWYLAAVYYGHGAYGAESASYRYFDKAPGNLTLAEAAMLAGLPQSPIAYDPFVDFEAASRRQRTVLELMVRQKKITQAQMDEALATPVVIREGVNPATEGAVSTQAPHFSAYVRELVPTLLERASLQGALRVTTTLDADLQAKAEATVKSQLDRFEQTVGASNGSLVAIDPRTGEILAMVGSHDFFREDIPGQVNNATALNQPGSTMKAVTYLTAFLRGWSPATIVVDDPLRLPDGESYYTVGNADGRYRGSVPVRTALGSSLNVPAVKALQYVGLEQVYALARRMGVTSLRELSNYGPAFTLGGVDVSLLDMTYVYSVLANEGQQAGIDSVLNLPSGSRPLDPVAILEIKSADGKVLWRAREKTERIVPAEHSYLITNVLADDNARVSGFGANSSLNLPGRPAAVKTGSSDEVRDLWAIGYTPQLVTGVWVGNADNTPMVGGTSSTVAAPIWRAFMEEALKGKPVQSFRVPDGIEQRQVCASTGLPPSPGCSQVVNEVFVRTRAATPTPLPSPTVATVSPTPRLTPSPTFTLPTRIPTFGPATATPVRTFGPATPVQPTIAPPTRQPTQPPPTLAPTQPLPPTQPPTQAPATPTTAPPPTQPPQPTQPPASTPGGGSSTPAAGGATPQAQSTP